MAERALRTSGIAGLFAHAKSQPTRREPQPHKPLALSTYSVILLKYEIMAEVDVNQIIELLTKFRTKLKRSLVNASTVIATVYVLGFIFL